MEEPQRCFTILHLHGRVGSLGGRVVRMAAAVVVDRREAPELRTVPNNDALTQSRKEEWWRAEHQSARRHMRSGVLINRSLDVTHLETSSHAAVKCKLVRSSL